MIFNISSRTDIPAFYTPWLLKRLEEGFVMVRNPYDRNKVCRYEFHENDILCFVSKDFSPLIPYLGEIAKRFRIHLYYTVTGYGRDMERNVPPVRKRVETFIRASEAVGIGNISWRYDPIMIHSRYDTGFHERAFSYLCESFSGYTELCIFSFISLYKGVRTSIPGIRPVSPEEGKRIVGSMAETAAGKGIVLQTCAGTFDYSEYQVRRAGCISPEVLGIGDACRPKASRPGCLCVENRDIGAYGTCMHGCLYCYAGACRSPDMGRMGHHEDSPFLAGTGSPDDVVFMYSGGNGQLLLDL